MAQLNRAYTPYAVDSLGDGSKDELTTNKGSYQNPVYENSELAHQYEDPSRFAETVLSSKGPRRKRNELYEQTEPNKSDEQENYRDAELAGDSWLSRLILFLVLVVSLTSLLLVVLIILGKVGPSCSCSKDTQQGGDPTVSKSEHAELSKNVQEMKENLSSLQENSEKDTTELWLVIEKSSKRVDSLSALFPFVNASLNEKILHVRQQVTQLDQKVNNISKTAGPVGPPGFNGSQGDAGPPGPKCAGNFSSCRYKVETGNIVPGNPDTIASKTEPTDKIILGAACSTNFAAECNIFSQQRPSGKWQYVCRCRGTSTLFAPQAGVTKQCFLHYWECPLST